MNNALRKNDDAGFLSAVPDVAPKAPSARDNLAEADVRQLVRIAVLDDDRGVRALLGDLLRDQGYRVSDFSTAPQLLDALQSTAFEVVLSDIKMPVMSGIEFYQQVVMQNPAQARRIVFLTGDDEDPAMRKWLEPTGNACLAKPFSTRKLLALIEFLLQENNVPDTVERTAGAIQMAA